ncbi:MAG: hypothetical protein E2598_06450 [Sphingobium sp.]|nr:hypothetical protein [Sphingobium sp.]
MSSPITAFPIATRNFADIVTEAVGPMIDEKIAPVDDAWAATMAQLSAWMRGPATGGPDGNGYYPWDDGAEPAIAVPSPAKMAVLAATMEIVPVNPGAGAAYTLLPTDSGKRIAINHADATVTVTVPLAPVGTIWFARQMGAGALKFMGAAGVTIINRRDHNGTAGRGAGVSICFEAAGVAYLDGDTDIIA